MLGKPSRRLKKHLEEHGKKASAVVVEIASKGMAITNGAEGVIGNTTLELKTKLRVEPNGAPSFEIEKRFRYGQLAVPSAGMKVGVIYDPDDHDKIMLDDTAPLGFSSSTTVPGGRDMNDLLATVKAAQAESHGDREELAKLLRERLQGENVTIADGADMTFGAPQADPLDRLEKLAKLHKEGVLSDEEYAKAKAQILAEGV
jgi:hypothetical protein